MNIEKKKAIVFLEELGMGYQSLSIESLLENFIEDMRLGLLGQVRSLLMIPTYIRIKEEIPLEEPVLVMDAGGTNFRVALVTFRKNGPPEMEGFAKYPMPGSQGRISKETFLNTIVDYMDPLVDRSDRIGFCFSFPTEILPNHDGKLLGFNKEIRVDDSAGLLVGEAINETLRRRGKAAKKIVLLNDTVAAMFSAVSQRDGREFDSYIGLILGTGTNTCYLERCKEIQKIQEDSGMMAINMESGGWSGVVQGQLDVKLDQSTDNPGDHIYEKMVSGAYQGQVILLTLQEAARRGLFKNPFAAFLLELASLSMRDVDEFCRRPFGENPLARAVSGREEDRRLLYELLDANFERAAKLMTVNIGGILLKTETGNDPTRPVCVVTEGTSINRSEMFRGKLKYYVKQELQDRRGLYCHFMKVENATMIGTAAAGLMN